MSGLSNVAQLVGKPAREVRVVPGALSYFEALGEWGW